MDTDKINQLLKDGTIDKVIGFTLKKYSFILNVENREDIRQELLIAAWTSLPRFDENRGKLTSFLVKCFKNEIFTIARKHKNKIFCLSLNEVLDNDKEFGNLTQDTSNLDIEKNINDSKLLKKIISDMSQETYARYINKMRYQDIAFIENKDRHTITSNVRKNMDKIRQKYWREYYGH